MNLKKALRIGNAGGYWGDDPQALKRQVENGHLDYITMDFLAEVTMSILQKQHAKDPSLGYARDFIPMLEGVLPQILKNKTRIITNAGGINPQSCARAIAEMAKKQGLTPKIAVVYGDDILSQVDALTQQGAELANMETAEPLNAVKEKLEAANVYFGAVPVVEALKKWSPDIIITGRVTDTGITVAPMIYEFEWSYNDWNKIASGVVAGHMLECGTQITGGNFTDWAQVKEYHAMGFPIVEVEADGSFTLTKHPNTGGMVSINTVKEQLFYEMGNPKAYLTPDVVANFTSIELSNAGSNRVKVSGITGWEPTPLYKVSMAYIDGYKCIGSILISGPHAHEKAKVFADIFWNRCQLPFTETSTEYVGWDSCHKSLGKGEQPNEIILRLGARSQEYSALKTFSKMIPSLILSGPPGVAILGGAPKIQNVVSYWPALLPKEMTYPKIALFDTNLKSELIIRNTQTGYFKEEICDDIQIAEKPTEKVREAQASGHKNELVPLYRICLARSGDKGDSVNIGIIARSALAYDFIKEYLNAQKVKNLFQELCLGKVTRYALDNLLGLNFILDQSLGGGGSCTLRPDAQGKTFGQALLQQAIAIPPDVLNSIKKEDLCPN